MNLFCCTYKLDVAKRMGFGETKLLVTDFAYATIS